MAKKKTVEPEYRLNIFYRYDEQTRQNKLVFLVRTVQEFVSFNYEIMLEEKVEGNIILLNIGGLNTPSSLMPGTGPARGKREFTGLKGLYALVVKKPDDTSNDFKIKILPDQVLIVESPKHPFVLLSNQPVIVP
jgi:hypothetical protein